MSDEETPSRGFYRQAFWWMMGLGATGIVASVSVAFAQSKSIAVLQATYSEIRGQVGALDLKLDRLLSNSATLTSSADLKQSLLDNDNRLRDELSASQRRIDDLTSEIAKLREWRAAMEARAERGKLP